jgi:hypothetical protein
MKKKREKRFLHMILSGVFTRNWRLAGVENAD